MKPLGSKVLTDIQKRLRGGSQSFMPFSPAKGATFTSFAKGVTGKRMRNYITPRQNPNFSGLKHFGGGFK